MSSQLVFAFSKGINLDERTVEAYANTENPDRSNELVLASAFSSSLKAFAMNPVIPFAHQYRELPVGRAEDLSVDEGVGLKFKARFAKGDEFADRVFNLFKQKILNAFSVGFFPKAWRDATEEEIKKFGRTIDRVITDLELIEISVVPVPANREALALALAKGMTYADLSSNLSKLEAVAYEVSHREEIEAKQSSQAETELDQFLRLLKERNEADEVSYLNALIGSLRPVAH